jgi:hypothetical protein
MANNLRQIQSFQTNPMFIWQPVPCAESYTFKWERKGYPSYVMWERNLKVSEAVEIETPQSPEDQIPDIPKVLTLGRFKNVENNEFLMLTYSKDLPPLNELTPYLLSVTAKNGDDILTHSQSEIVVFEKRVRDIRQGFKSYILGLQSKELLENFTKFIESVTISFSGPVPPWYDDCYSIDLRY